MRGSMSSAPDSMIERVARAICASAKIDPDKTVLKSSFGSADRHPAWTDFRTQARSILEAMRDPTSAMLRKAPSAYADDDWHAMIEAALGEEDAD